MKTLFYCLLTLLPAYFIIQGCNKVNDISTAKGQLIASKSTVKINEPDPLQLVGAKSTDTIKWTVTPTGYNNLVTQNNKTWVTFTKSGNYTVKASNNGATPSSVNIVVNDSTYTAPVSSTISLAGDQITLIPAVYKSSTADSSYIYFTAKTTNSYCSVNKLNFTYGVDANNNYNLNFINITQVGTCNGGAAPLVNYAINMKQNPPVLTNGTYPLTVGLNGTTYTGSIVVSSTNVTFNWNYSSGVIITSKQLSR